MNINYNELSLVRYDGVVTSKNRESYYQRVSNQYTTEQIDHIRKFQSCDFVVSGTSYILPCPITNLKVVEKLFWPQGFVIIEGDEKYYTNRIFLDSFLICYTLEGKGEIYYHGKTYIVKKGEGFFIDCKQPHEYRTHGEFWKASFLHINGPACQEYFDAYIVNRSILFSYDQLPGFEMLQFNILRSYRKISASSCYRISCLIDLLLTELLESCEKRTEKSETIGKIIDYFEKHLDEKITLGFLTKEFGISQAHLERKFKRCTGYSPGEYLQQLRMRVARELLEHSEYNVQEIAEKVGFVSASNFILTFKKAEGITPLQYRKKYFY